MLKFWFNDDYYCTVQPGQFGYGWDLYDADDKLVAASGLYFRTKQAARDEARDAIPVKTEA